MRQLKLAAVLLALLVLAACPTATKSATTLPPGALNTFDANSYVTLMGAQAALNTVKADFAAGKVPASAKPALNDAIASYNTAESAWQSFHAGKSNDQAALTAAIAQAVTSVSALITQVSGGK